MKVIERLIGRGDAARGREMLDDAAELFEERRRRRGWTYATARHAWDIAALLARPRSPRPGPAPDAPGSSIGRLLAMDAVAAWRGVRSRPVIGLTVSASLALGLGLAMLTFTLVDGILLRPLPFPRPHELLLLYSNFRPESGYTYERFALSGPEVADYAAQNQTVEVAAYRPEGVALADGINDVDRVPAARLSSDVFRILETAPLLGRTFTAAEDAPGAPCVAVLAYGLWRDRFLGDAGTIGRVVRINGEPCEVAGVMPLRFAFPTETARLWLPLAFSTHPDDRGEHGLAAVGRLRKGTSLDRARDELSALMTRWERDLAHHKGHAVVIAPMLSELVVRIEDQLLVLAGAVTLVLLTIATNMSNLLLAHGEARRREMAVRGALGAGRASLIRQLLFEGWLLAVAGGVAGGALAWLALGPILEAYPATLPRARDVRFDWRTAGMGLCVSLAIGTLVSLLPALRLTSAGAGALRTGDRAGTAPAVRVQRVLVISELAIGVAVAVGALLLVQSFVRLQQVPLGFNPDGVTTAIVGLPRGPGRGAERTRQFFTQLRERLEAHPGVHAAGAVSSMPLVSSPPPDNFTIEGRPIASPSARGFNAGYVMATPGFFEAMEIGLVQGRALDDRDATSAPAVAVINEALVRAYFPHEDPIGRRIRYPEGIANGEWSAWGPWIAIVGIAEDIRSIAPAQPPQPAIYVPHAQMPRGFYDGRTMGVVVRAERGADVPALLRRAVRELDADASLSGIRRMDDVAGAAVAQPRFMGWIMTTFAAIAVAVAALGVYGVVAYGVAWRRREIAVRLALGASRASIASLVGAQTLGMTAAGLAIGLGGAAGLAAWMRGLLFEVEPFAFTIYAGVAVVLAATAVVATVLPARRAMRVDPLIALKAE